MGYCLKKGKGLKSAAAPLKRQRTHLFWRNAKERQKEAGEGGFTGSGLECLVGVVLCFVGWGGGGGGGGGVGGGFFFGGGKGIVRRTVKRLRGEEKTGERDRRGLSGRKLQVSSSPKKSKKKEHSSKQCVI